MKLTAYLRNVKTDISRLIVILDLEENTEFSISFRPVYGNRAIYPNIRYLELKDRWIKLKRKSL